MPELIFDNTVLSNFATVGKLDILARLYAKRAYTTVEVIQLQAAIVKKLVQAPKPIVKVPYGRPAGALTTEPK
jgi:predicted nucleic acid-binding protein